MPITTKQDVRDFGTNVVNTLQTWGQQIQYARDLKATEKIKSNLSDVNKLTLDKNGNVKSLPEIYNDMFKHATNISTKIMNPELKNSLGTTLGQMYGGIIKGLGTQEQKKQDIGMDVLSGIIPESKSSEVMNYGEPTMTKVTGFKGTQAFQPHYKEVTNTEDPNKMDILEILYDKNGRLINQRIVGSYDRTKQNIPEQFKFLQNKIEGEKEVRAVPTTSRNSNFNTSLNVTPQGVSFIDPTSKKTINTVFRGGKYYDADNPTKQIDVQGLTPMSENINPYSNSNSSKQQTAWEELKKELPRVTSGDSLESLYLDKWLTSAKNSQEEIDIWTRIEGSYGNNAKIKNLIWNLKYPEGKEEF